jgi:predicted metal-dependent hydrolase
MPTTPPAHPDRDRNAEGRAENARPRDRFGAPLPRDAVDELAHAEEPGDVVATMGQALERAISLWDEERFFEAHEFLEFIWKHADVDPADRDFWKGVTQVAVGCCHTQRGNTAGSVTLLERAAGYLDGYPDIHHAIDRRVLAGAAIDLAARVRAEDASPDLELPRFPRAGGASAS